MVAGRAALLLVDDDLMLVGPTGRVLVERQDARLCPAGCALAVHDDRGVIPRWDRPGLLTVDLRTGEREEHRLGPYTPLSTVGGRLFGLRERLAEPLLPAALAPGSWPGSSRASRPSGAGSERQPPVPYMTSTAYRVKPRDS